MKSQKRTGSGNCRRPVQGTEKGLFDMNYTRHKNQKKAFLVITVLLISVCVFLAHYAGIRARAEEQEVTCWIMCKPGGFVNLRMWASRKAAEVGRLDCGDSFKTDGKTRNGFVHCLDRGDCDCWVWAGNVVFEEPQLIGEKYTVIAKNRVACRRWIDGPQIEQKPWILNGTDVDVFVMADGWAVTSRGYIKSEWLEADPE